MLSGFGNMFSNEDNCEKNVKREKKPIYSYSSSFFSGKVCKIGQLTGLMYLHNTADLREFINPVDYRVSFVQFSSLLVTGLGQLTPFWCSHDTLITPLTQF